MNLTFAGQAHPAGADPVDVALIQWMPVFAFRFRRIDGHHAESAQFVHAGRDGLQMRWVHAGWCSAEMVELKFFWDGGDELLISPSVCVNPPTAAFVELPIPDNAATQPDPAFAELGDLRPKPGGWRRYGPWH